MLIAYKQDGAVVSISGFRDAVPSHMVESLQFAEPLPEGESPLWIHDSELIAAIWEADDQGQQLKVVLSDDGQPHGITADGVMLGEF